MEAKAAYHLPEDGLQQAKAYAQIQGLKFAYSTNGHGIVEHDFLSGHQIDLSGFPNPEDLWGRPRAFEGITDKNVAWRLLSPCYHLSGKSPRYYQDIAINRTVQPILPSDQPAGWRRRARPTKLVPLGRSQVQYTANSTNSRGSPGFCNGVSRKLIRSSGL